MLSFLFIFRDQNRSSQRQYNPAIIMLQSATASVNSCCLQLSHLTDATSVQDTEALSEPLQAERVIRTILIGQTYPAM